MKTFIPQFLAVALMFTIGIVAAGTATAGEQPIWHNFVDETTLSGTLPSDANLTNTARIWQTQVETFQKDSLTKWADRQVSPEGIAATKPIWCEQRRCL